MVICQQIRDTEKTVKPAFEKEETGKDWGGIFVLSLFEARDGHLRGKFRHVYCEEPFYFSDLTEAILKMGEILDVYAPAQLPSPIRSFEKVKRKGEEPSVLELSGEGKEYRRTEKKEEAFYIRVHCRQNSSWQGEIRWQNGRQKMYFRSVLELLRLLDSAFGRRAKKRQPEV